MVLIIVDVKAKAKSFSLEKIGENHYLIRVKTPAKKGKANLAVTKLLEKHFKTDVKLVGGFTSKRKFFLI